MCRPSCTAHPRATAAASSRVTLLRYGRIDVRPFLEATRDLDQVQDAVEAFAADPAILKMQVVVEPARDRGDGHRENGNGG